MCWKCVYTSILKWYKSTQCFFLNPYFKTSFLKSGCSEVPVRMTAPTIVDWQDRLTLDPPWVSWELSASGAGEDKMSPIKRLRCFVVGCNNEYSSHLLFLTSEQLKTQRINATFALKWNALIPDLPKCIYVRANHSWSSFIYRRSEYNCF